MAYVEYLEGHGRYKEAAGILQEAIDADNGDPEVWWELGRIMEIWAVKGDELIAERIIRLRTGCQAYKAACEIDPEDETMREGLHAAQQTLEKMELEASPAQGKAASRTVSPSVPGSTVTTKETQRVSPMQGTGGAFDRQTTPRPSPANSTRSSNHSKSGSSNVSSSSFSRSGISDASVAPSGSAAVPVAAISPGHEAGHLAGEHAIPHALDLVLAPALSFEPASAVEHAPHRVAGRERSCGELALRLIERRTDSMRSAADDTSSSSVTTFSCLCAHTRSP